MQCSMSMRDTFFWEKGRLFFCGGEGGVSHKDIMSLALW